MEKRIFAMKTKNSYTRHYGKKSCIRSGGRLKYYYVTDIYGSLVYSVQALINWKFITLIFQESMCNTLKFHLYLITPVNL